MVHHVPVNAYNEWMISACRYYYLFRYPYFCTDQVSANAELKGKSGVNPALSP